MTDCVITTKAINKRTTRAGYERRLRNATIAVMHRQTFQAAHRTETGQHPLPSGWQEDWAKQFYHVWRPNVFAMIEYGYNKADVLLKREGAIKGVTVGATEGEPEFLFEHDKQNVEKYLKEISSRAAQTHAKEIDKRFREASVQGYTPAETAKYLQEHLRGFDKNYSMLIARTTTTWSFNEGAITRYAHAGIEKIGWLTTNDDLTCPYCMSMDERVVGTRTAFVDVGGSVEGVDGSTLNLPPEIGAIEHPPLHPYCRCALLPVLDIIDVPIEDVKPKPEDTAKIKSGKEVRKALLKEFERRQKLVDRIDRKLYALDTPYVELFTKLKNATTDEARKNITEKLDAIENTMQTYINRRSRLLKPDDYMKHFILDEADHVDLVGNRIVSKRFKGFAQIIEHRLRTLQQLVHKDTLKTNVIRFKKVTIKEKRKADRVSAFFTNKDNTVHLIGDDSRRTISHEVGHFFEHNIEGLHEKILNIYKKRTKNDPLEHLNKVDPRYGEFEFWKRDKWIEKGWNEYDGKYYPQGATELISDGINRLLYEPVKFAKQDPEIFDLIVNAMRGVL